MSSNSTWVISANMGLGHLRATYSLKDLAYEKIFLFGEDLVLSPRERFLWKTLQRSYEFLSKTQQVPVIGPSLFNMLEKLQNISPFYPYRDQSAPSLQVKSLSLLMNRGLGKGLCQKISYNKMPIVTSFYAAAIIAEKMTDLPIYCIICDSDINRVWVTERPAESRINYLVPCGHAMQRLKQYGVRDERIFITGFPLPHENIGGEEMPILKYDLSRRLDDLDISGRFHTIHGRELNFYLGVPMITNHKRTSISITFAVGGAGAQMEIAQDMIKSLSPLIKKGTIKLNLVAGIKLKVKQSFDKIIALNHLTDCCNVSILFEEDINNYFTKFNSLLRTTDILWTKPSELSFYCGLGIPIITSPHIGPHEAYNSCWLRDNGAGICQEDARYASDWIMDFLNDGRFAQCAWDGFLYARKMGTYKILEVLKSGNLVREISPLKR